MQSRPISAKIGMKLMVWPHFIESPNYVTNLMSTVQNEFAKLGGIEETHIIKEIQTKMKIEHT